MHMWNARWLMGLLLCVGSVASAWAADATPIAADPELEARVMALSKELRCLVCQNQTVADSTAPLAVDLKDQVREQLRAGKSQEDIVRYMTDRYGDFVLYKPPFKATTAVLWGGPVLLALIGMFVLWRSLRGRQSAAAEPAPLSDAERERAAKLLGSVEN